MEEIPYDLDCLLIEAKKEDRICLVGELSAETEGKARYLELRGSLVVFLDW